MIKEEQVPTKRSAKANLCEAKKIRLLSHSLRSNKTSEASQSPAKVSSAYLLLLYYKRWEGPQHILTKLLLPPHIGGIGVQDFLSETKLAIQWLTSPQ